jgi:hypothetical protein
MYLKCNCGHEWDYKGKASFYALCPKCKSKIQIDSNGSYNLSIKEWIGAIPIEVNIPENMNEVITESQEYAQKVFGEPSPQNWMFVLNRVIRFRHSNYRDLLKKIERRAKEQGATQDQILDAYKFVKDRIDIQISDFLHSNWRDTWEGTYSRYINNREDTNDTIIQR